MIDAGVAHVFGASCPATIAWLVVAILVGIAVKLVFRRGQITHVRKEIGEYYPAIANTNAAPSVVTKDNVLWIGAAFYHICPATINRCHRISASMSVREMGATLAALLLAVAQSRFANPHYSAAHAQTLQTKMTALSTWFQINDFEFPENSMKGNRYTVRSHDVNLQNRFSFGQG